MGIAMILNRILKNFKKLDPWAKRNAIESFRLYDHDIPEFPFIVDLYLDFAVIYDKSIEFIDKNKNQLPQLIAALEKGLKLSPTKIIIKKRQRQEGFNQYEKLNTQSQFICVREGDATFEVNLYDYLDTGLFLDHRPMRYKLLKDLKKENKNPPTGGKIQFLNLFCYTGSMSVIAALAGAQVTSVDMSATYIDWCKRNFKQNQLKIFDHEFVQMDALKYICQTNPNKFDFIFLDPPTFSNSKKMEESFEVERDQLFLVENTMSLLKKCGILYFSNNKRDFKLDSKLNEKFHIKNITEATIPIDFHNKKIHQCYKIQFLNGPSGSDDSLTSSNNRES